MAKPEKPRWEYTRFDQRHDEEFAGLDILNLLGEKGWEAYTATAHGPLITHHLKRRKT